MCLDDDDVCDSDIKFNLFAQHFYSIFYGCNGSLSRVKVNTTEVPDKLKSLDPNKSAGPDNVHPLFLKLCAPVIAPHLAEQFNSLVAAGIFPSILKHSYNVPIFKSCDRGNIKNYIPHVIVAALLLIIYCLRVCKSYF